MVILVGSRVILVCSLVGLGPGVVLFGFGWRLGGSKALQ